MKFYGTPLQITETAQGYQLTLRGTPLATPAGKPVTHSSRALLRRMRCELEAAGDLNPARLNCYCFYSTQTDFVETARKPARDQAESLFNRDPALGMAELPDLEARLERCVPLQRLLQELQLDYRSCAETGSPANRRLFERLLEMEAGLTPAQTAVWHNGINAHHSFLLPLLLATGACSPSEYTEAVTVVLHLHPVFQDALGQSQFNRAREEILLQATAMQDYLTLAAG